MATVSTLKAANKLVRDNYHSRRISARINQLRVDDPRQVHFIGWSDAALANRRDLSLTGGYVIAATAPSMIQGHRSPLDHDLMEVFEARSKGQILSGR